MRPIIDSALSDASEALDALRRNSQVLERIEEVARALVQTFHAGGKVIAAGNGGSMCDAMHLAEELAGRFRDDRRALPAIAISDPGLLSCVANDYGYERVFARFLEAHGRPGDLFVGISTSGNSPNVLAAASTARAIGMRTVGLVGRPGSPLESGTDVAIVTPAGRYSDRIQELHIKVIHVLIELVEREMFAEPRS
jgi:D-sedoheptulose 7-phosphate isomerase